jgi:hypothetical protein
MEMFHALHCRLNTRTAEEMCVMRVYCGNLATGWMTEQSRFFSPKHPDRPWALSELFSGYRVFF